jgi:hypothetical protein
MYVLLGVVGEWKSDSTLLALDFTVCLLTNCASDVNTTAKCWFILPEAIYTTIDRLCGLVVRVLGYRSGDPDSIPGTTRKKSSGSGTGSTQPREYN